MSFAIITRYLIVILLHFAVIYYKLLIKLVGIFMIIIIYRADTFRPHSVWAINRLHYEQNSDHGIIIIF